MTISERTMLIRLMSETSSYMDGIGKGDINQMIIDSSRDAFDKMSEEEQALIMVQSKRLQKKTKRCGDLGALEVMSAIAPYLYLIESEE